MSQLNLAGRTSPLFLHVLVCQALSGLDGAQPHWGGLSALPSPLIHVSLIWKHHHRHRQEKCLIWTPVAQSRCT